MLWNTHVTLTNVIAMNVIRRRGVGLYTIMLSNIFAYFQYGGNEPEVVISHYLQHLAGPHKELFYFNGRSCCRPLSILAVCIWIVNWNQRNIYIITTSGYCSSFWILGRQQSRVHLQFFGFSMSIQPWMCTRYSWSDMAQWRRTDGVGQSLTSPQMM